MVTLMPIRRRCRDAYALLMMRLRRYATPLPGAYAQRGDRRYAPARLSPLLRIR